ncbi:MAG: D-alanyl-D-alanine carboxypeptidase [Firmicutes bacterium]|nr:D-alanyl-D-alanine carboxypeptidase [Bacillota bacterium]
MRKTASSLLAATLVITIVATTLSGGAAGAAPYAGADLTTDSPCCVLMDYLTGEVLYEKNPDEKRAPASLTKIMTLVVALEAVAAGKVKLDDPVTAGEGCELEGTQVWAEPGETHPLRDWLTTIAVGSANDACKVVAEYVAGSEPAFVSIMNERARQLGVTGSEFKNSHGLDEEGHMVTSRDMAIIGRHAVDVPGLLDLTKIYQTKFRGGKFNLDNANKMLVFFPGCDGLKTGSTDKAGYCVVNTAQRDGKRFISVVMGAPSTRVRFADSTKMLNYAFANYQPMLLVKKGHPEQRVRVWKGAKDYVDAVPEKDLGVVLKKGEEKGVAQKVNLKKEVLAPVRKGDALGEVTFTREGGVLGRVNLVAAEDVKKKGMAQHFVSVLKGLISF